MQSVIVVMGVSGSGKSAVGARLALRLPRWVRPRRDRTCLANASSNSAPVIDYLLFACNTCDVRQSLARLRGFR